MSEVAARCAPFEEDLSALLDGQLDSGRSGEMSAHLASCAACARRLEALRGVDGALQRLAATPVSSAQRARMRPAIRPAPRAAPRRRRWLAPAALVATAAAAAALLLLWRPTAAPVATDSVAIAAEESARPQSLADAEAAGRAMAAKIDTPMGASAAPSDPNAPADEATVPPPALLDASDEDVALAMALREFPALAAPRDLEVVEQLDRLETLGALDDAPESR